MLSFSGHPFRPPPSADHSYANGNIATMVASGGGPVYEIQGMASVACQTDITSSDIDEEKSEITRLREQLGEYQDRQRTTRENFVKHMTESDSNTRYFTGMPSVAMLLGIFNLVIVRRAGLLWSQQDFEWRWSVPLFKCLTVLEFSFILFDLCLSITFFNFIMNYVPIVTFWIFTYHKIWILSIMFCFIWSYWIIYFLACLEVSWRVVS